VDASIVLADQGRAKGLIKVATVDLQKDESGEAWFQNKLYDVLKRETKAGVEYVYLLRDMDEQQVLEQNNDFIGREFSFLLKDNCLLRNRPKPQSITDLYYLIPSHKNNTYLDIDGKNLFISPSKEASPIFQDVNTPPPRLAHCLFLV
jgi:hypothetical protein